MSVSTIPLTEQNIPKKFTVLGAQNRVKVTTGTSHGITAALTFSKGTPFSTDAITPSLYFKYSDSSQICANPLYGLTVANPLTMNAKQKLHAPGTPPTRTPEASRLPRRPSPLKVQRSPTASVPEPLPSANSDVSRRAASSSSESSLSGDSSMRSLLSSRTNLFNVGKIAAKNLDKTQGSKPVLSSVPALPQFSKATAHPESTMASSCNLADQTCLNSYFNSAFLENPNQCSLFDPARISNRVDKARIACQGEKVCGVSLDAVVTSKQSKTVPHPEGNLDSPADPIASRAKNTTEKVYSKKTVNPCYCLLEELSKNLTKFFKSSDFRRMQIGDSPRAQTISLNETVSEACSGHCWYQLCGKLKFTAQSSHSKPFGGLAWAEHPSTHFRGRRLQSAVPSGQCTGPTTNYNLLNTGVTASQSYGYSGANPNANVGCDGVLQLYNPSASNTKIVDVKPLSGVSYWVAEFQQTTNVQSILYIEQCQTSRISFLVGDNPDFLNNPSCTGGQLIAGGWLDCGKSGKYLVLISTTGYFEFMEVMCYSQYFVHHNALSSTLSSTLATAATYLCTTSTNCKASNVIRTTLVILNNYPSSTPCCIYSDQQTDPELKVTLPADLMIKLVTITPSDQSSSGVTAWQQNIEVSIMNASGVQELCGTLADYNTYKEVPCNKVGNQIIIKRPGSSKTLSMAGPGIMSDCDCSQSSFDPAFFTSVTSYALSGFSTDALKTIKVMPDTVSSVCGLADGFTQCPHSVSFTDSANNPVTFPYNGFTWNAATFVLTLDPAQALHFCQLNAIVSLASNPLVTRTQVITSTIIQAPSTPAAPVTAISGTSDVTITWAAPADGGLAITGYTVAILQSDGVTYSTYAGCTGTAISCTVPISVLQATPYNLVAGSSVFAKVKATNSIGSSAYSSAGNGAAFTVPSAPAAPATAISVTNDVAITWTAPAPGSTPITGYTVQILQSDGVTYSTDAGCSGTAVTCTVPISVLQAAPYNLANGASVYAQVKAINIFGASAASTSGNGAVLPTIPQTPVKPTTKNSGTNVVINWVAPADGGSMITDYAVTIKKSDGTWSAPLAICTGTGVSCTVTNTVLQASPYNLPNGASVHAQVRAINSKGSSAASSSGNGAVLPTVPTTPEAPTTSISSTNVLVTWKAPADGGSEIMGYKVAIRQSDGTWSASLASCTGTAVICSIPISVLQAAPYNIAEGTSIYASVIATNLIGSSSASTPGNGAVIVSQNQSMLLPSMKLNAVIGKEASLLLPEINGVSYIVLDKPHYQVSVEDLLLKVKSDSDSDIGSHKLQINAKTSGQSGNITVNVIFSNVTTTSDTAPANKTSKTGNLVLSVQESDSLLETTTTCNTTEAGILPCVTDIGFYYSIDPSKPTKAAQSEVLPQRPTVSVSRVNSRGSFFIKFSQAMNILALKNTKNDGKLQEVNATNQTDSTDNYRYLLSPKHLRIEVKSENATKAKFTWYAKNITSTKIEMQLVFKDPLSISNDRSSRDMLVITVLPPALRYFKTLASGALTKNPLQTLALRLPPQSILGTVMNSVSKVAKIMEDSSQYTALANLAAQLTVSGSMGSMWSMLNAFQIVNTFNYLETNAPGNVRQVMNNLNDMLELSALETDQITSSLFNFTETQSPGTGFDEMGNDSKVLTAFIGNLLYIGVLILLVYLLYGFVHGCGYSDRRCKRFDLWLQPKLIWSALICYQLETSLDFGIGTLLKFEEPNLNTTGDVFDLGLSIAAVILLLVLPLTQVICLCKNKGQIDDLKFKQKWGSLYSDLKTFTPGQRETAIKMFVWLLLRRILTVLNLVELRNQTIWIQLTFNMWLCLADACLLLHWSPYKNKTRDIMEKFNGAVVLLLSQLVWMQTDLIPSAEDRYYIGWYYLGALAVMFVVNISVVVISALKYPKEEFKRCLLKRKQKKARDLKLQKLIQKNSMLTYQKNMKAQKNGLPPGNDIEKLPIQSKRTLLVLKIKELKRKPRVNHAQLKQLEKKLVALDKKRAEQWFIDGALIDAKILRNARSRTSTNGKVGSQPSKQIDNRPTKIKLRELLERQAAEAKLKEFQDQRQTELEIRKIKQLKEEEQAKILEEQRQQRINQVNSQWLGSIAYKNWQQMEEEAILQFARKQKIEEFKRLNASFQQKNAVSFELNMWLNSNMQQIQQKREEDAILQFAREELKRPDPRPENEKRYFEEEQRRFLRIHNKLQNREQISEQEMSKIDLEQQKPRPQLRRGTDAEFSFRAYK